MGDLLIEAGIDELAPESQSDMTLSSHHISMFGKFIRTDYSDVGIYRDADVDRSKTVDYFNVFHDILISLHADFVDLMCAIREWKTTIQRGRDLAHSEIQAWFRAHGFDSPETQLKSVEVDDVLVYLRRLMGPNQPLCKLLNCLGLRTAAMYPRTLADQLAWIYGFSDQLNSDDALCRAMEKTFESTFPGKGTSFLDTFKMLSSQENTLIDLSRALDGIYLNPVHVNVWTVVYFFPQLFERYFDILSGVITELVPNLMELEVFARKLNADLSSSEKAREHLSAAGIDTPSLSGSSVDLADRINNACRKEGALYMSFFIMQGYHLNNLSASTRVNGLRNNNVSPNTYATLSQATKDWVALGKNVPSEIPWRHISVCDDEEKTDTTSTTPDEKKGSSASTGLAFNMIILCAFMSAAIVW
ncbi:hypothetical protein X943_001879 [Babesia divergens]|uniref:Uncharacterized protein n=1 Tax=Babesia divergens TaxID=32595 RepID=A0AAD9LE00_BABDI|nr:hypothetical protein X943_001879 [Babesia divergens]